MIFEKLWPVLRAGHIHIIQLCDYQEIDKSRAMRRVVDRVEAGKHDIDTLYLYIH